MYCIHCSRANPDTAKFCSFCGAQLATQTTQSPAAGRDRLTLGIYACAFAIGVNGALSILSFLFSLPFSLVSLEDFREAIAAFVIVILGIFSLATAYGLFRLSYWAWKLTIALNSIGIIMSLTGWLLWLPHPPAQLLAQLVLFLSINALIVIIVTGIAISLIVIVYLLIPSVRALFKPV